MPDPLDAQRGVFGDILIGIARSAVKGALRGLMRRYSVDDLRAIIAARANVIEEALRSDDPRDQEQLAGMQRLAEGFQKHGPQVREQVTAPWLLSWLHARFPEYARVIDTPAGREWLRVNVESAIAYFFPA